MGLESIPEAVRRRYHVEERGHAAAILAGDFSNEFKDIMSCLEEFVLRKTHILTPGGGRSLISTALDGFLHKRGWREKSFDIQKPVPIPTHRIDNFKTRSCWKSSGTTKLNSMNRDLNNFRLLKELRALAAGVIRHADE